MSVPAAWGQPQAELVLHFVQIGQGDCTLIQCPNGGFILLDAGSTARGDRDAVRNYIRDQLDEAIPAFVDLKIGDRPGFSYGRVLGITLPEFVDRFEQAMRCR